MTLTAWMRLTVSALALLPGLAGAESSGRKIAEAKAPDLSADIASLNYYPHAGMVLLGLGYSFPIVDYANVSTGGWSSVNYDQATLSATIGLPHRLRLGIGVVQEIDETDIAYNAADVASTSMASGLSNPTASLAWRFWEESKIGWSGDLALSFMPSLGPHLPAAPTRNGNFLSGQAEAGISAAVFWRVDANEAAAVLAATAFGAGESNGITPAATTSTSSYENGSMSLRDRIHVGGTWFVEGAMEFDLPYYTNVVTAAGVSRQNFYNLSLSPKIKIGGKPSENWLFEIAYAYRDVLIDSASSAHADFNSEAISDIFTISLAVQF